jgi:hypothetical protein
MKTKIKAISLFCVLFIGGGFINMDAEACSVLPLNAKKTVAQQKDKLEALAIAALGVDSRDMTKVEITDEKGDYIHNSPMCPEGRWISANVTVQSKGQGSFCTGTIKITHRVAKAVTVSSHSKRKVLHMPENNYKIDIIGGGNVCYFP